MQTNQQSLEFDGERGVLRSRQTLVRYGQSECVVRFSDIMSTVAAIMEASDAQGNKDSNDGPIQYWWFVSDPHSQI